MADYNKAYYPAFLDLAGRRCVVVGGGKVAARKVRSLLRYGAAVHVVAGELDESLSQLEAGEKLTVEHRDYVRGDLKGAALVICATNSKTVNRAVFLEAKEENTLVNVVDVPERCNFIVPSVVRRGQFQIAISTGGAAPAVAKRVKKAIGERYGDEWETYVDLLGRVRKITMENVWDEETRTAMFEKMADSGLLSGIMAGEKHRPEDVFAHFLREVTREREAQEGGLL